MTHDEFVGHVQSLAKLPSRGDAERVIRVTLETLAERLDPEFADNLAAQVPQEIARHLRTDVPFQRLSLNELFQRIRRREAGGTDLADAVFHARCVVKVLQAAVTHSLVEKLHDALPAEFEPLLEGSRGSLQSRPEQRSGLTPRHAAGEVTEAPLGS